MSTSPIPNANHAANHTVWADSLVAAFMRRWLLILLLPLTLWVLLPLAAPVAMHAGWTGLGRLIYLLYTPFCHQLPQRSWFFFGEHFTYSLDEIASVAHTTDPWQLRAFHGTPDMGWKVAWSDRMISLYAGFPLFGWLYLALRRWRPVAPISLFALALLLLPLALDGGTHLISDGPVGNLRRRLPRHQHVACCIDGQRLARLLCGRYLRHVQLVAAAVHGAAGGVGHGVLCAPVARPLDG